MKRLTGLDGVTLHGETSVMPTHVPAVLFCDPATRGELTARAILRQLAERTSATGVSASAYSPNPLGWASRYGSRTRRSLSTTICIMCDCRSRAPCASLPHWLTSCMRSLWTAIARCGTPGCTGSHRWQAGRRDEVRPRHGRWGGRGDFDAAPVDDHRSRR